MKKLLTLFSIAITSIAMACGSGPIPWTMDYISAVNGITVRNVDYVAESNLIYGYSEGEVIPYVDSPLTVTVGLFSSQSFKFAYNDTGENVEVGKLGFSEACKLQYRVLPNGKWITVSKYTPYTYDNITATNTTGTIVRDGLKPKNYFGRNNIDLKGLAKGTTVMIRLVTNNEYATSGDESNMCTNFLTTFESNYGTTAYMLPQYGKGNDSNVFFNTSGSYNIGGGFRTHNTITVIYTGNERVTR